MFVSNPYKHRTFVQISRSLLDYFLKTVKALISLYVRSTSDVCVTGSHSQSSMNVGSMSGSSQRGPSMPNGPVSQSSPALTRRVMDPSRDYYYNQPYSRQQPGY